MNVRFVFLGVLGLGAASFLTACSGASTGGEDDDDGGSPQTNQDKIESFCDAFCKCEGACSGFGNGDDDDDDDGSGPIGLPDGGGDGEEACVSGLESLLQSYEGCSQDATADYYACLASKADCDSVSGNDDGTGTGEMFYDQGCNETYSTALSACQGSSSTTSGGSCSDPVYPYYCSADDYCMPSTAYCNGYSECSDGSDEAGCNTCSGRFSCYDGVSCGDLCDDFVDCPGGEDESGCPSECTGDEYDCGNNYCVDTSAICNGISECPDGSDELGCACPEAECNDGTCIPQSYVCDGFQDCTSGEDELSCEPPECESGEVQCNDGECILDTDVCDGSADCTGGEDELSCEPPDCGIDEFQCADGVCIPESFVCDEATDCTDGEDEDPDNCP